MLARYLLTAFVILALMHFLFGLSPLVPALVGLMYYLQQH